MTPFCGDTFAFNGTVNRIQAILPSPDKIAINLDSRWDIAREEMFLNELNNDLWQDYSIDTIKNKSNYYIIVLEDTKPYALALMDKGVIALSSRYIELLNFMSAHIDLQRKISKYIKTVELKPATLIEIDGLNEQMALYYTAISSACLNERIRHSQTFKNLLSYLKSINTLGNPFRFANAWIGFTLLHEIGHYEYSHYRESVEKNDIEEEYFCDRYAIRETLPNVNLDIEEVKKRYIGFIDFVGQILIFFTNRWLSDFSSNENLTHPATFKRTAHLLDIVNTNGEWTNLRNNLESHWLSVNKVNELDVEKKIISSGGLHEAISEKIEYYMNNYKNLHNIISS